MISFIILHYKNIHDTIECIESIKKINYKKKSIVIVDNNTLTKNNKEKLLMYTDDIIELKENIGFAKANNIGCSYAIKKYNPDFLCVINNDIIINQKDFITEVYKKYDEINFDILGPKILTNNGDSVNPFHAYQTVEEIDKKINYSKKMIKIYNNSILRNLLVLYMNIKHIFVKPKTLRNGSCSCFDVALHGCALIFSKKYYLKFKDVFYSNTFLYHEEEFLDYRRRKNNLITYYDSDLEVFHKEGASLNESFKYSSDYKKIIFRHNEIIKSLEILKKIILNNEDI